MTKSFTNLNSTAINSVTIEDNVVKVVYNSNVDKEYTFNCENVEEFVEELSKELISIELEDNQGSVGRFINKQIKDKILVESK
jgi:RNase H-fold protein (predicted Holliday junction resolvase)